MAEVEEEEDEVEGDILMVDMVTETDNMVDEEVETGAAEEVVAIGAVVEEAGVAEKMAGVGEMKEEDLVEEDMVTEVDMEEVIEEVHHGRRSLENLQQRSLQPDQD